MLKSSSRDYKTGFNCTFLYPQKAGYNTMQLITNTILILDFIKGLCIKMVSCKPWILHMIWVKEAHDFRL